MVVCGNKVSLLHHVRQTHRHSPLKPNEPHKFAKVFTRLHLRDVDVNSPICYHLLCIIFYLYFICIFPVTVCECHIALNGYLLTYSAVDHKSYLALAAAVAIIPVLISNHVEATGNKVASCFDIVAGVDWALQAIPLTGASSDTC